MDAAHFKKLEAHLSKLSVPKKRALVAAGLRQAMQGAQRTLGMRTALLKPPAKTPSSQD